MNLGRFTESGEIPTDDSRATGWTPEILVAPDILELLSSAMYVDPITIYREYVQNAADAIDIARSSGLLEPNQPGRVDITMNAQTRSVRIRDNGCGIASEIFCRHLLALGGSAKRGTSARGFRGVGRLAGLGYAREVIFRASAVGETTTSELRWDCLQLKEALRTPETIESVADLIKSMVSYDQHDGTDANVHFFEVELKGVVRLSKDQLMSPSAINSYLSQVAPVPFKPGFSFGNEIMMKLSRYTNTDTLLIHINGAKQPIYRPHEDRIPCDDQRQLTFESIDIVELPGVDGDVAAIAWVLHHQYEGGVPRKTLVGGLRLRSGNIQVGDHTLLRDLFPETRFNGWSVGEIHVFDSRIIPNGRRDHFQQNVHYGNLLNRLLPMARVIARKCRTNSARRKWEREFMTSAQTVEDKISIMRQGSIRKMGASQIAIDIEKLLLRMGKINEMKILELGKEERGKRLMFLRTKMRSLLNEPAVIASPLARLPDRERETYQRFFEMIYECSANRNAAKALIDRILMKIDL